MTFGCKRSLSYLFLTIDWDTTSIRKENQLKQQKKDEENKAKAVRRVCVHSSLSFSANSVNA